MELLRAQQDASGNWRALVAVTPGNNIFLKFPHEPTLAEIQTEVDKYQTVHQYDETKEIPIEVDREKLRHFIQLVKVNPTVTLTQYNTWLGTKPWYEQAQIRFYVFVLATKLAEQADVTLADFTESQILLKLRNWIAATPIRKIERVIGTTID